MKLTFETEQWRPIIGSPDYEVSDHGRVRSLDRIGSRGHRLSGKILKQCIVKSGYAQVSLGASRKAYVHRLVCEAWHGDPKEGQEVSHLDGVKANNLPGNLTWATHAENEQQKRLHGTYDRPRVFKKPHHKKRGPISTRHPEADEIIRMRQSGATIKDVASFLGMSVSGAFGVIKNRCFDVAA